MAGAKAAAFKDAAMQLWGEVQVDDDGDLFAESDGVQYVLYTSDDDDEFLRLTAPGLLEVTSDDVRWRALWAVNEVNRNMKVAKAYVNNDKVHMAVELVIPRPDSVYEVLAESRFFLNAGVKRLIEVFHQPPS